MSNIRAVVFDMDGTLLDSRELIYQALEHVLMTYGVSGVTREHMAAVTGKPVHAMYSLLAPGRDDQAMERAHLAHHVDNMHLLAEYDGVHEVLKALRAQGLKLGIFTGFHKTAYDRLDQFGLTGYFESIVETTRYTQHKPHPEGLLLSMEDLGMSPAETVYVGDGVSDIGAGKAANVRAVVGVTHGFGSRAVLKAAGADYLIDSLAELLPIIRAL